jgi:tetratricopeptide (TPR) repeat protein
MASSRCELSRARLAATLWVLAIASPAAAASSQADEARAKQAAEAKLTEGLGLLKNGQFDDALDRFRQAYALVPSPLITYDFGLAYLGLGDNVRALESFETFLTEARGAPDDKRWRAERYRDELRARVAVVEIASDVGGAELIVDGRSLGPTSFPRRISLAPGLHNVGARDVARGAAQAATVSARAGEATSLVLHLAARTLPPTPPTAGGTPAVPRVAAAVPVEVLDRPTTAAPSDLSPPAISTNARAWALSAAALGAVSLGVGLSFGAMAQSNGNALTTDSMNRRDFMPEIEAAGLRNQRIEVVCLSVAAAAFIAGLTIYAVARHREGAVAP